MRMQKDETAWGLRVSAPERRPGAAPSGDDLEARRRHPSYPVMPLAAVHELIRLQRRTKHRLRKLTAPILVAHGARDHTARPADAQTIHDSVASPVRELVLYEHSAHIVPVDRDGPALSRRAADFLGRCGPGAASQAPGRGLEPGGKDSR